MKYAIDVSFYDARRYDLLKGWIYDRPTDWVRAGVDAALIKSSQGLVKDPGFDVQWKAAAGMPRLAWHFLTGDNPFQQAAKFVQFVGELWPDDRLAIDYEKDPKTNSVPSMSILRTAIEEIRRQTGQKAYIYTGGYKWYEMGGAAGYNQWAAEYPLWLAHYPYDPKMVPALFDAAYMDAMLAKIEAGTLKPLNFHPFFGQVKPFPEVAIWQFTDRCSPAYVPGHPGIKKMLDFNVVYRPWWENVTPPPAPKICPTCGQTIPA